MPTSEFDDPRIAEIYDIVEGFRDDLVIYADLLDELGARSALDVGCGTGVLGHMLLERGYRVVGVEPAGAMIERARRVPGADRARWVHGYLEDALPVKVDAVTMTANTAMVFADDDQWAGVLQRCRAALDVGGHLVFEARIREVEAWRSWGEKGLPHQFDAGHYGQVSSSTTIDEVTHRAQVDLVTFTNIDELSSGEQIRAVSTLAFRSRSSIEAALGVAGFDVSEVRDAPDRPGRQWVFVARAI